jgi:hypothetical protein
LGLETNVFKSAIYSLGPDPKTLFASPRKIGPVWKFCGRVGDKSGRFSATIGMDRWVRLVKLTDRERQPPNPYSAAASPDPPRGLSRGGLFVV